MKIKKRIAGILATIMLMSTTNVLGNVQVRLPADAISPIVVDHILNSGTGDISPSAQITFKPAPDNVVLTTNVNDKLRPDFYRFLLQDINGNKITSNNFVPVLNNGIYIETVESRLANASEFKNGTLYKIEVEPGHIHVDAQGKEVAAPLSTATRNPHKYFLTDFNTIMRERNESIEVVWEYIPGATYDLVYIDKDVSTKAGVDGTDGSQQTGVGSQSVTLTENDITIVVEGGVKKAKYIIPNTVPGQKYSAYVMVKSIANSFLTDKWENVGRNIETPKIAQASRSVDLSIYNIGRNRIQLKWTLGSWADNNTLKLTKVYRKMEGETAYTLIGTLNNELLVPRDPGKFEHDEPNQKSLYYVEFIFTGTNGDESLLTKETPYVPYELREQPLKPQVPKPYSDSVKGLENFNRRDYVVTNDDVSVEKMKPNTFHMLSQSPLQIQLVWNAPKLSDGTVDYELTYDLWVAEDAEILQDEAIEPVINNLSIDEFNKSSLIYKQDNKTVIGFKTILTKYIDSKGDIGNLVSNKTYYIKIVAKRNYSGEYSISQPTTIAITIDKNGDIFTPPVLAKPPLKIQDDGVDTSSIKIEWLEEWYEITANNPSSYADEEEQFFAKLWSSRVFTGGTPSLRFKPIDGLKEHILTSASELEVVKNSVGPTYSNEYRDRKVTLGADAKYEVKTLLYDDVIKTIKAENANLSTANALTIEKWIVQNESDTTEGWNSIIPNSVTHDDSLPWKGYKVDGLEPNTRYIILVRVHRELDDGTKLVQTFPGYVIGTTETDRIPPEALPTVPVLNANGVTDESISVWWTYNDDFDYEIVYSRLEDPNKAITWDFIISNTPGDKNYVSNGAKAIVTITDLVPDTTYNIWIRAKQKKGSQVSNWSNPVTQKTKSIENPDVPRGLGPAAYQSILALGLDFPAIGKDYITVEWLRDVEDLVNENMGNKSYSYILEFAENPEFLDSMTVTSGEKATEQGKHEILDKTMVKFNGLEANRPYYIRVKTVLTYKDSEGNREIIRESEFTTAVRILTKTSNDEYDGGENDNIIIYPEAIVDSYTNGVWTKEIVDTAKVISQIQSSNQYFLTITMENYKNKYDADVRRVKMPKNIIDTLSNRGMALKIVTNVGIYEIPGKALKVYASGYSARDLVQFDFTKATVSNMTTIGRSYPEVFIKGERFEVTFKSSSKNTGVQKLDDYMKIKLKLELVGQYNFANINTYTYSYSANSWSKQNPAIETQTDSYFVYSTPYTGLHALYQRVTTTNQSGATYIMNQLKAAYDIRGLGDIYLKQDYVNANQYIQLLMGIAQNKSSIDLTSSPSNDLKIKAKTAGIYISQSIGALTKEQAIAGVVKLYELKQGYQVKPSKVVFKGASTTYKDAVGKAYALGLIDESMNPSEKVTYSELCDWIIQVIE